MYYLELLLKQKMRSNYTSHFFIFLCFLTIISSLKLSNPNVIKNAKANTTVIITNVFDIFKSAPIVAETENIDTIADVIAPNKCNTMYDVFNLTTADTKLINSIRNKRTNTILMIIPNFDTLLTPLVNL